MDVGASGISLTLTTGLQSGATYNISIEALSNQLPSARVGPEIGELLLHIVYYVLKIRFYT